MNLPKEFRLISKFITGSHLYGTNTPESDIDTRGVFIPDKKYFLGFLNRTEQFEDKVNDVVFMEIRQFLRLATDCNPNIIEWLFVPEKDWLIPSEEWRQIVEKRDLFLSKKARYTFAGYAFSQLRRIKRHRSWLLSPPKKKPIRADFGLPEDKKLVSADQIGAFNAILANYFEEIKQHHPLKIQLEEMQETRDFLSILQSSRTLDIRMVEKIMPVSENFLEALDKEKRYGQALREWNQYQEWKKNRNPERAELEKQYGFDCYAEETEFLTENGWKKYDEISKNEKLATLNPTSQCIEYQNFINRVKYKFNGDLWLFSNQNSMFFVTGNHKLFVNRMHRNKKNHFSAQCDNKNWEFISVDTLMNSYHSHYNIIQAPSPNANEYDVSDDYLKIMGLYVSEGSLIKYFRKKTKDYGIKSVVFSQLEKNNKIEAIINSVKEYEIRKYVYTRRSNQRKEVTYIIYNAKLSQKLFDECAEYSKTKTLPKWVMNLSRRQAIILLKSLIAGDGTVRKYSDIYFTYSKSLAENVQLLALHAGFITKLWYYPQHHGMFQVYINKRENRYGNLKATFATGKKSSHFKKIPYNGNVVCFEVPNSILVTRFSGEISFQGNSKHGSHLYRLLSECEEILIQKHITFPRPDAEMLLAIRNGCWNYDRLMEEIGDIDARFDQLYQESSLPKHPDRNAIDRLCIEIVEKSLAK